MAEFHRESLIWAQEATTEGHLTFLLAVYLCFLVCLFTFLVFDFNSYRFFSPQVCGSDLGKMGAPVLELHGVVVVFLACFRGELRPAAPPPSGQGGRSP